MATSLPWLRLWDRTLDSPKSQRLTGENFKGWINLLMLANRQNDRGRLPGLDEIAFALRTSEKVASKLIDDLVKTGLIDREGDTLRMHDWKEWQPEERTNADRARRWRDEQKRRALNERTTERISSAPDTDTDTDTEEEKEKPPSSPRKRGEARAAFVLPEWVPRKEWDAFMESRRKLRKIPTDHAKDLLVRQLEDFRAFGHDPAAILNKSTERGWTGLFAPDGNGRSPTPVIHKPVDEEKLRAQPIRINDRMSPKTRRISIEQNRANGFPDDGVIAS